MPLPDPNTALVTLPEPVADAPLPEPGPASLSSRVDLLVQAGSLLLQHGADAGRVEASLQQMEAGLGIERIDVVSCPKPSCSPPPARTPTTLGWRAYLSWAST